MLSEGTLLSGGERDRKIAAWDSLQNYKKITEIKVGSGKVLYDSLHNDKFFTSFLRMLAGCEPFILNVQEGMTETFMSEPLATTS